MNLGLILGRVRRAFSSYLPEVSAMCRRVTENFSGRGSAGNLL